MLKNRPLLEFGPRFGLAVRRSHLKRPAITNENAIDVRQMFFELRNVLALWDVKQTFKYDCEVLV